MSDTKFDFDTYLSFPREKIERCDIEVGMLLYKNDADYFILIKGDSCGGGCFKATLFDQDEDTSEIPHYDVRDFGENAFELVSRSGLVIGASIGEKVSPERKDYCHTCKNDNLVWVMMAARCSCCNAIILGGA